MMGFTWLMNPGGIVMFRISRSDFEEMKYDRG